MTHYRLDIEPVGRRGICRSDRTVLETMRNWGVPLTSDCGGQGICGQCRIRVAAGVLSTVTSVERDMLTEEELAAGYRLACMAYPRSDCKLVIPPESLAVPMRIQVAGVDAPIVLSPAVQAYPVQLQPPDLHHPRADVTHLLERLRTVYGLAVQRCDLSVLQQLSPSLRAWHWRCQAVVRADEVMAVQPLIGEGWDTGPRLLGLAVDVGSTSMAGYLVDLDTGATLAAQGAMNPQISYGEDIISRLVYARRVPDGAQRLRQVVLEAINELAEALCAVSHVHREHIVDAVIVGNTVMHHLLLGLPTEHLAVSPFVPVVADALDLRAREVGLQLAPGAYLHILPNIAGFVGADHVAMLLATEQEWQGRTAVALDIGTNTEISLILPDGRIRTVSCASGPAFEGYHIRDGMRAQPGAVERVRIEKQRVHIQTIAAAPPVGICGSGILDAVAQLRLVGVLNEAGRIISGAHPQIRERDGEREFVLVETSSEGNTRVIGITQHDVREIQLAKASIQTGIEILLADCQIELAQIERFIIAGAFGAYIDVANAIAIGMFPDLPPDRFRQVGNAAGVGAKLALLATTMRRRAQELCHRVEYLELAAHPRFARAFARNCRLHPFVGA